MEKSTESPDGRTTGDDWIRLVQKREFSRLLYPNPVCFLCTSSDDTIVPDGYQDNVMTITWLTAIDNEGRFVMSLNKSRHTAKYMKKSGQEFCLCVPVAGMESLALAVGSKKGNFGSKFVEDTRTGNNQEDEPKVGVVVQEQRQEPPSLEKGALPDTKPLSKRQKKLLERIAMDKGIPGLVRVPVGGKQHDCASSAGLFCIEGTVAHLHCKSYMVDDKEQHDVDDGHYLIFAEIIDAYCKSDYWNETKKIFCPKGDSKPYLTFFGSQTFGHVVSGSVPDE
jgi:flavin reductase (DIM6/NTAB) family NADH-FMN oxidoreductase RutF